jgi:hypothetical protein
VILLADPELVRDELDGVGVEVLRTPVNVNALVELLLPQHSGEWAGPMSTRLERCRECGGYTRDC